MLFDFDYPCVWDALRDCRQPIVLYGMGNGADKVLDEFARRGISAAGVMASDSFARYQPYRGFIVKRESDFVRELGDFTVALCFASALPDVMAQIRTVASRHDLLVPSVPVIGDEVADSAYLTAHRDEITQAYRLLADDMSQRVFRAVLHFYYTGRLSYTDAVTSGKDEVFREILRLRDERYLDLGAYRGDTVDEFLRYTDGYERIIAVEPNPKNYRKLTERLATIERAAAVHAGVADRTGIMYVTGGGGRMASLSDSGDTEVPVVPVDALAPDATYLKADIEGMERLMLLGARETLTRRPKLNLAAYHRAGDFFGLILQLHALNPDYRIYLRKHPYIPCWDLNIYAV